MSDGIKLCDCGCMYDSPECPYCNRVTDKDRLEKLEADLDEAVLVLQICCNFMEYGTWPESDPVVLAQKTIAKLKGQDDE